MILMTLIVVMVPVSLLIAIAFLPQPTRLVFALSVVVYGLALLFAWLVFPWQLISLHLRTALPWVFVLAVFLGYRRAGRPGKPVKTWAVWLNAVLLLTMGAALGLADWKALQGYRLPEHAIALAPPLRNARFVIGQGGGSAFINGHARVAPQNHALDILALNRWGLRADPFGEGLERFVIFGMPVYSPCDGRVTAAVDGLPDLPIGQQDRENLAGNHVLLECQGPGQGAEVVLAHLREGSVSVSEGQLVSTQTRLGAVGNSGNTSEPHLHIHAKRGARGDILDGEAVPFTIDGRYLVRGDMLESR